jgi:hypothetical protein
MISRKAKIVIITAVVIISGLAGASAAVYYLRKSTTATIAGAPSEQEIETQIVQASSDPKVDRIWNNILNVCMEIYNKGMEMFASDCNGSYITEDRDSDCQTWDNKLLICNRNSALGKKLQSYLNVIGYTERS